MKSLVVIWACLVGGAFGGTGDSQNAADQSRGLHTDTQPQAGAFTVPATQALERACAYRDKLTTGTVQFYHSRVLADQSRSDSFEVSRFAPGNVRQDIIYRSDALVAPEAPEGPLDLFILTDKGDAIRQHRGLHKFFWSFVDPEQASSPFDSAKGLGLPGYAGRGAIPDLRAMFRLDGKGKISSCEVRDDEVVVTLTGQIRNRQKTVSIVMDPSRAYVVTAYETETVEEDGTRFTIKASSEPEQFDGYWFPRRFKRVQRRNGEFDWSEEFVVVSATFNEAIDPSEFSWHATNITRGAFIYAESGRRPDIPYVWDGEKVVASSVYRQSQTAGESE